MLFGPTWSRAPAMSSVLICCGVGRTLNVCFHCCATSAEMPVTTGDDIDVPSELPYELAGSVENCPTPMATSSGLTRPSFAGPRELKGAMMKLWSMAPTATMFFSEAMKLMVLYGPMTGCFTVSHIFTCVLRLSSVLLVLVPGVRVEVGLVRAVVAGRVHVEDVDGRIDGQLVVRRGVERVVRADVVETALPYPDDGAVAVRLPAEDEAPGVVVGGDVQGAEALLVGEDRGGVAGEVVLLQRGVRRHPLRRRVDSLRDHRPGHVRGVAADLRRAVRGDAVAELLMRGVDAAAAAVVRLELREDDAGAVESIRRAVDRRDVG